MISVPIVPYKVLGSAVRAGIFKIAKISSWYRQFRGITYEHLNGFTSFQVFEAGFVTWVVHNKALSETGIGQIRFCRI